MKRMNKWAGKGWQEWVGLEPIDPTKFTATITIEDENEDAVVGALITLTNTEDLSVVFSGTTDEGGVCSISNIEPKGVYSLLATHNDYESIEQSITINSNISIPLIATAKSEGYKIIFTSEMDDTIDLYLNDMKFDKEYDEETETSTFSLNNVLPDTYNIYIGFNFENIHTKIFYKKYNIASDIIESIPFYDSIQSIQSLIKSDGIGILDASVQLKQNEDIISSCNTGSIPDEPHLDGIFNLMFFPTDNPEYVITISKDGYQTVNIDFDTRTALHIDNVYQIEPVELTPEE